MTEPVTMGRKFGLGRANWKPREHCKRCAEIVELADQTVMNYILANGRQVEIINRLLENPDHAAEVISLAQLLAEKDSLISAIYNEVPPGVDGQHVRDLIDEYRKEVADSEGHDA